MGDEQETTESFRCPNCGGFKWVERPISDDGRYPCPRCNGTGKVSRLYEDEQEPDEPYYDDRHHQMKRT